MSTGLLVVVAALVVLAFVLLAIRIAKAAAVFGLVAAGVYAVAQYVIPFWEAHLAPLAGSFF